jgi:hypothetical protein
METVYRLIELNLKADLLHKGKRAVNYSWLCSQYEGGLWQHEASSVLHKLQEISMAAL